MAAGKAEPPAEPLRKSELPAVNSRPVHRTTNADRDVRIQVARKHTAKLKRAVRRRRCPVAARAGPLREARPHGNAGGPGRPTAANDHRRGQWVRRVVGRLDRRGVKILFAQL